MNERNKPRQLRMDGGMSGNHFLSIERSSRSLFCATTSTVKHAAASTTWASLAHSDKHSDGSLLNVL